MVDPTETDKGQVGLDEYQVRRCDAGYRHVTLARWAHAFLAVSAQSAKRDSLPKQDALIPSH